MSTSASTNVASYDLDAVLEIVNRLARLAAGGRYIFRGEPKAYPTVSSSLYRRYADIDASAFDIEVVQKQILEQAKGYTSKTDDFEILSQLQHNGGATNLIDFTGDFLIALFFACYGEPGKSGRVVLLSTTGTGYDVEAPSQPVHRIIAQKSVFVRPQKGFVEPDYVVDIPGNLKHSILNYLIESHGIFTETVYNDLHGFIRHQGIYQSDYVEFYRGVTANGKGKYQKAIEHYTKAVVLNPQSVPAYNNLGATYYDIGDYKSAIQNYGRAMELDHDYLPAYYNRGEAWLHLSEWDNARADFATAKGKGADIVEWFRIEYSSVADFEQRSGITVPSDIAEMLGG